MEAARAFVVVGTYAGSITALVVCTDETPVDLINATICRRSCIATVGGHFIEVGEARE